MRKGLETSTDVFKHCLYVLDSRPRNVTGTKSSKYSSKKESENEVTKGGNQSNEDTELVEAPVIDRVNVISAEIGTAMNIHLFNLRAYHHANLLFASSRSRTRTFRYVILALSMRHCCATGFSVMVLTAPLIRYQSPFVVR